MTEVNVGELRRLQKLVPSGPYSKCNGAGRGSCSCGSIFAEGEADPFNFASTQGGDRDLVGFEPTDKVTAKAEYVTALLNAAPVLLDRLELLEQKAERYREALEFYANEKNYDDETGAPGKAMLASGPMEPVEYEFDPDMGTRARVALEGSGRAEGSKV